MAEAAHAPRHLLTLARSKTAADRERLLFGLIEMCEGSDDAKASGVQAQLQAIFLELVGQLERDMRADLATRLAAADWPPHALIAALAQDEIEIARPVIAASPLLSDGDLIRLLVVATVEHHIAVARRDGVGAGVVQAILDQAEPDVMTALAGNPTAVVEPLAMQRLVEASRRLASLRAPLARHPRLTAALAESLRGWVGDALRSELARRFALTGPPLAEVGHDRDGDGEAQRTGLVAKLAAAGELRPSFLLRALREGKLALFEQALARLLDLDPASVRLATGADRPAPLALACAAAGIDRSVFPTILSLTRALNRGRPGAGPEGRAGIDAAFAPHDRPQALRALHDSLSVARAS